MGEMSGNGNTDQTGSGPNYPRPASGPMDEETARWYVEYTDGQFQRFHRDGHWYLHTPGENRDAASEGPGARR
jgi:hypothetical protein